MHYCAWNHNEQMLLPKTQNVQADVLNQRTSVWLTCPSRYSCMGWRVASPALDTVVQGTLKGSFIWRGQLFGILNCYCIFVLFLFSKNGYPGREWASKDTHPQVIHLLSETKFVYVFLRINLQFLEVFSTFFALTALKHFVRFYIVLVMVICLFFFF